MASYLCFMILLLGAKLLRLPSHWAVTSILIIGFIAANMALAKITRKKNRAFSQGIYAWMVLSIIALLATMAYLLKGVVS